jgi:MFS family permease
MFGMAGGAAGQFLVGPAIAGGLPWNRFWILMSLAGLVMAGLLYLFTPPKQEAPTTTFKPERDEWVKTAAAAIGAVFRNPQSILCGLIAGLLFLPTTIFDMLWGVRFLQESHDVDYSVAVLRSASVPFGWIIGSPLLGLLSDRIGRRKPVIIGSFIFILYGPPDLFPVYSLGLIAGMASGGAMIPYTVIKEANRPEHGGTATGVINFINFSLSALLGPVFGTLLTYVSGGAERELVHYQTAFAPLGYGVALAILLTLALRETGPAARTTKGAPKSAPESHSKGRPAASHQREMR